MKPLFLTLILLFASSAQAADIELGIGHTTFNPSDNGVWWQQGLDHHLNMDDNSINLGLTDYLTDSIRWHAGYMHLGKTSTWAIATSDANFTGSGCATNPCAYSDVYIGSGEVQGVYLTAAPEYNWGNVKLIAEGGLWFYKADFNMVVIRPVGLNSSQVIWNQNKQDAIQIRPVFGLGVEYNKVQLMLDMYGVDSSGEEINHIPNYKGSATNLSLIARF